MNKSQAYSLHNNMQQRHRNEIGQMNKSQAYSLHNNMQQRHRNEGFLLDKNLYRCFWKQRDLDKLIEKIFSAVFL